ncbi:MAG: EAL domain-containing protein [Oscillospiraceae bacterium]|nr:EAL domain-containing protein [Oscillospiraceae bacterium]
MIIYLLYLRNGLNDLLSGTTALWNIIFGTAWTKCSELFTETGAFLLDHKNKTAESDKNLIQLAELDEFPDYDKLSSIISELKQNNGSFMTELIIAEETDDHTAGFIRLRQDYEETSFYAMPVYNRRQLIRAMTDNSGPSLLALIKFAEYGSDHISEKNISGAVCTVMDAAPKGTILSSASKKRFWIFIPDFTGDEVECLKKLRTALADSELVQNVTFTAGCGAKEGSHSYRMQTAEFTLYDAEADCVGSIYPYSDERYDSRRTEYDRLQKFTSLLDNNLFTYHFQPIVSSRDGEIVAYEALMRSDKSVGMYPLEILELASKHGRLYDVEKATMQNTLEYLSSHQSEFADKQLFINAIPSHMLSHNDWSSLEQNYGELMEKLVIEMTEQSELDNEQLKMIKDRLIRCNIPLAIDDYGSGYSNTANLLRYSPNYVKLDRSLISNIDTNPKLSKLVSGTIEFIHENGYLALAEGVETYNEMKTMIQLGADFIQGYYISKPKPFAIHEISETVRNEISRINVLYSENIVKVYHPEENETVDLDVLSADHYTSIFIDTDNVVFESSGMKINSQIIIKDNTETNITFRNVRFATDKEDPTITLGQGSVVHLTLEGNNEIHNRGIWVPVSSEIHILGSGSLHVISERIDTYGIGTDIHNAYGSINIECCGRLIVEANGETGVAIGGGFVGENSAINILSGDITVMGSGGSTIGIGNFEGNSNINISNCVCNLTLSSANCIGIGSMRGKTTITADNYTISETLNGTSICGIGSLEEGVGSITISNGQADLNLKGRTVSCIGAHNGNIECNVSCSMINLYGEGNMVSGIGDIEGSGDVTIEQSCINVSFRCNKGLGTGSKNGKLTLELTAPNIRINE